MNLSEHERDELYADLERVVTERGGTVCTRDTFDDVCEWAACGDRDARVALLRIFKLVTAALYSERKQRRH